MFPFILKLPFFPENKIGRGDSIMTMPYIGIKTAFVTTTNRGIENIQQFFLFLSINQLLVKKTKYIEHEHCRMQY